MPADTTVTLDINAQDVAHSWWIPKLGGKFDAIPGYTNHTWFKIPGKLGGHVFTRPVRRAVRAQPREHDRPASAPSRPPSTRRGSTQRKAAASRPPTTPPPSSASSSRQQPPEPRLHGRHRPSTPHLAPVPQIVARARRARARRGWTSWVTTTDHKRIGIMYLVLDVRLLHPGRGRGAADAPAARPGGQHAAGPRRRTTSCSRCTGRR